MTMSLLLMINLLLGGLVFSQKRFMLNENEKEKFKMATRLFYKGEQLFTKGHYKKAKEAFNDCLEKFPQYANADYYLGRIYYDEGDYLKALEYIERAKKNFEILADLEVSTQLEYMDKLRQEKLAAEEELRSLRQQLAIVLSRKIAGQSGELENQINQVQKTISDIDLRMKEPIPKVSDPPADFFYIHGNILFKIKRYKDSLDQYLEAVRINPQHGNAFINIANLNFMAKRYEKALFYLEKAESCGANINPDFRKAIYKSMEQ
jgi:tetratricopeptide (TPR) repeat protein